MRLRRRKGARLTEFLRNRVVIFFVFIFIEVGLFNCNPVPRGTKTLSRATSLRLTRLQLDLEISLSGVSAKVQRPQSFFTSAEDALQRRVT
jgi:hypothetical protein